MSPDDSTDPADDVAAGPIDEDQQPDTPVIEAKRALPQFVPGGAGLGEVLRMEDVRAKYGEETESFVQRRLGRGFVVRLFDGVFGAKYVDSIEFGEVVTKIGRATAWVNNALYGSRYVPGVEFATNFASMVVQFSRSPDEDLFEEDHRSIAPTAVTGHWLAALTQANESDMLEAARVLRPRATGTYLTALEALVDRQAGVEWLLMDGPTPRRVVASRGRLVDAAALLDQPVRTVRRPIVVTGILYAADQYRHTFKMDVSKGELAGRTIRGTYRSTANESLQDAWRREVDVRLVVVEAEKPGLPRAPRTQYELAHVERVHYERQVSLEPVGAVSDDVGLFEDGAD